MAGVVVCISVVTHVTISAGNAARFILATIHVLNNFKEDRIGLRAAVQKQLSFLASAGLAADRMHRSLVTKASDALNLR